MNQAQRNFLIKKIEDTAKIKIKALEANEPESPNLENYLVHSIMSDKFELQPIEHIRKAIVDKVLSLKKDGSLLGDGRHWGSKETVNFNPRDIFVIPEEYEKLRKEYKEKRNAIIYEIGHIQQQSDNLILRIQLASDKTLQKMINEIDDMGDLSLMDTKIKLLSNE